MKIIILKQPKKFLEKLPKTQQQRIATAIFSLPDGDVISLKGETSAYRLRVGDWRIVFSINDSGGEITIRQIGNRGDVYKK